MANDTYPFFEQARRHVDAIISDPAASSEHVKNLETALRLAWNARGAADIATIENGLPDVWTSKQPTGELTRALRKLDR